MPIDENKNLCDRDRGHYKKQSVSDSFMVYIFVYNVVNIKSDFCKLKSICNAHKFVLIASPYCLRHLNTTNRSSFDAIHQIPRDFHHVDYGNVKEIVKEYVQEYGAKNVRLLTNEDSTQISCAKIREFYKIPGNLLDDVLPFVNKMVSKKHLDNIVKMPKFLSFNKLEYTEKKEDYLKELVEKLEFPMFAKPIDLVSSIATYKINDFSQLRDVADKMLIAEHEFEVDEFIDGDLFHCDLILNDGSIKFFMIGQYAFHLAQFSKGFPMGSIPVTDQKTYNDLYDFTKKVIQKLKLKKGACHLEVFLEESSKQLVFLEIAARTPGALLPMSYEIQFGINIEEWHYLAQMDLFYNFGTTVADKFSGWITFPTIKGTVVDIEKPKIDIQHQFIELVAIGQILQQPENLLDASCSVVFWDKDIKNIQTTFEKLKVFSPIKTENFTKGIFFEQTGRPKLSLENHFEVMEELFNAMPYVFWKDRQGRYLGCNLNQAKTFNFDSISEFVGKTIFEILNDPESARKVDDIDNKIMNDGKVVILEETLPTQNGTRTYLSQKQPLYDNNGVVIGLLGCAMDITEIKEKENLAKAKSEKLAKEKHQLEIDNYRRLTEEQERFAKIANQVSHDIRSPLSSLLMILKGCTQIPEPQRIALREAATGARDIANHLLNQYKKHEVHDLGTHGNNSLLVSTALLEVLTAKKYQYEDLDVHFNCHFDDNTHFAFIQSEFSDFRRMISNLINNAVDALVDNKGAVNLHLSGNKEQIKIGIQDTGKGMSPELIAKIMNKTAFTEGKKEGHGIGLTQVWDTISKSHGKMHIDSVIGKGTNLILTFPRTDAPSWLAEEVILNPDDTVIILDDDASIHGAWQTRFESTLDKYSRIKRKHFREGKEALEFIHSFPDTEKSKLFLLSDYELLKQELNGLHVIEKSRVSRSILVTSHYADPIIQEQAAKTSTKILPKELASEVPIHITEAEKTEVKESTVSRVDIVLVDDDEALSDNMVNYIFQDKVVDQYLKPEDLLNNIHRYSNDIKIYLDNNYDNSWLTGLSVAKELHEKGFKHLYLLSGNEFEKGELPSYLTAILKTDIEGLEKSKNDEEDVVAEEQTEPQEEVYAVLVDDNESFLRALQFGGFGDYYTETYRSPEELLENAHKYKKDVKIFVDNNFICSQLTGVDTAKKLHELGFTRIHILTGESYLEAPPYVTVIVKGSRDFDKLIGL